ncbi:hypothetical protein CLOSTMETH_02996 [[Clostridium] methylpentosum DSM 5476]|uniref:Uncharacterized protein n=1 Tax=[Clostridium] methylpentosum DSM 5476 TaxID=537013 RepID=C0EGK2_9FIRM|nr:hypothetical protein CLOSTMETH_02996 [[Clostridium] methylpentosum DSM 5476]
MYHLSIHSSLFTKIWSEFYLRPYYITKQIDYKDFLRANSV